MPFLDDDAARNQLQCIADATGGYLAPQGGDRAPQPAAERGGVPHDVLLYAIIALLTVGPVGLGIVVVRMQRRAGGQ